MSIYVNTFYTICIYTYPYCIFKFLDLKTCSDHNVVIHPLHDNAYTLFRASTHKISNYRKKTDSFQPEQRLECNLTGMFKVFRLHPSYSLGNSSRNYSYYEFLYIDTELHNGILSTDSVARSWIKEQVVTKRFVGI